MRVLVIGGTGLLGVPLVRRLEQDGHVAIAASRSTVPAVDISRPETIESALEALQPDAVVLAAAATDVDGVESDPDRAFRINAVGARNVAGSCRLRGVHLLHVSTDYVFDGATDRPYTEFDTPAPLGVYGQSKLAGEHYVLSVAPGSQVVRLSYLYGPDGPCFPAKVVRNAREGKPLRLISDTRFSPTSTRQAARVISRLLAQRLPGVYHVSGRGEASPLEWGRRALQAAGFSGDIVEAIHSSDWKAPARRPAYSVLRRYLLELQGEDDLEPWEDEVDAFVRTLSD